MPDEQLGISDKIVLHDFKPKRKTALMIRAGGLGDCLILTAIAKQLHKQGFDVDYVVGSPTGAVYKLIEGLPYFRNVFELSRINNVDCIKIHRIKEGEDNENDSFGSVEALKKKYDEVFDFKFSVENNVAGQNKREGWRDSINSNFQNWVDLSLSWANIDPTKIGDEDKRPEIKYKIPKLTSLKEADWVANGTPLKLKFGLSSARPYNVIGIQLQASSLVRSWYRSADLPEMLHKLYPNDIVMIWQGNDWFLLTKNGRTKLQFPEGFDPLICSTELIKQLDVFITADSGTSHVAEAVMTPTIGVYTTVPAWTRTKYYNFNHDLETDVICHPCFTLDAFCPLEKKKANDSLTEKEKDILQTGQSNGDIFAISKKYNTIPKAIEEEFASIQKKLWSMSANQPACVGSITPDMIIEAVKRIIPVQVIEKVGVQI